jgi:TPR repeat protein
MIEKAAYLGFAAAQYKIGWCYEYSQITCPFDPLLSVEYYSLASQQVSPPSISFIKVHVD